LPGQPAAFVSYVRFNDQHDDGWVSQFCELLSAEVRVQSGEEFPIFQDRKDIAWGQNWKKRINETLDSVSLLLAIMTPSFFYSSACRGEVARFVEHERQLGRDDLILPVYYVSAPQLDNPEQGEADELVRVLRSRQFADWRKMRFVPLTSPEGRRAIAELATRMRDTFWRSPAQSAESPPQPYRAGGASATSEGGISTRPAAGPGNADESPPSPAAGDKHDLRDLVREYSDKLSELTTNLGRYDDVSHKLVAYLENIGPFLREGKLLVERVSSDFAEAQRHRPMLNKLRELVQAASGSVNDYKATATAELLQREAESEHHNHRPNKRYREDQQELREVAQAAEAALTALHQPLERIVEWLRLPVDPG
jgi:hypothetical protein